MTSNVPGVSATRSNTCVPPSPLAASGVWLKTDRSSLNVPRCQNSRSNSFYPIALLSTICYVLILPFDIGEGS